MKRTIKTAVVLASLLTTLVVAPGTAMADEPINAPNLGVDLELVPATGSSQNSLGEATAGLDLAPNQPGSRCNFYVNGVFSGQRAPNGVVSGSWLHYGSIACNFQTAHLFVNTKLKHEGVQKSYNNNSNSGQPYVTTNKNYSCTICNGHWQGFSDYIVELGGAFVWLSYPSTCHTDITRTKLYCTLSSNPTTIR